MGWKLSGAVLLYAALLLTAAAAAAPQVDREPVFLKDFPFTPEDGTVLSVNPPAFVFTRPADWKPGKYTYRLEYAADPQFRNATRVRLDRHMYIPGRKLTPGTWFWRYAVLSPEQSPVWSKSRRFVVPPDIPEYAFPNLDTVAAHIPAQHPRLMVTAAMIPEIRRRAAEGDLREFTRDLCNRLRPHIDRELVPEPEFLPPRSNPERQAIYTRIFRATRPDQDRMQEMALAYLLTGDPVFGQEARRRILYFFTEWDPDGSTSLWHNDEPARWILKNGVPAYTWTYELFSGEERERVERSMKLRTRQMYDYLRGRPMDANPYESHANSFLIYSINASLILLREHPDMKEILDYALTVFMTVTPVWGKDDGGWNEGAAYWAYYLEPILTLLYNLRTVAGIDLGVKPFFRNTGYYPLIGWPGKSKLGSFGDGSNAHAQAEVLQILACYFNNPDFLKPARELGNRPLPGIWRVVCRPSELPPPNLSHLSTAWLFPGIGFVVMRNDLQNFSQDVALLFQSNPFGAVSHHHRSQNCIMVEAYGEPLAISTGYYDCYDSPHHARWTRETKSRCGITVDGGQGQLPGPEAKGEITRFETHPRYDIAVGEAAAAYPDFSMAERTIVHLKPGIFIIRDRCRSKQEHIFEYNLHAVSPGIVDETAQKIRIVRPNAAMDVYFFARTPWKFSSSMKFDPEPIRTRERTRPDTWHFRASSPEKSREMELISVLLPYRTGTESELPRVEQTADGVKLHFPNGKTSEVAFTPDPVVRH